MGKRWKAIWKWFEPLVKMFASSWIASKLSKKEEK